MHAIDGVIGTGSDGHRGYLLDGSDGSIIRRFIGASDAIGHTEVTRDLNGDGTSDVLFCGWDDLTTAPDLPAAAGVTARRAGTIALARTFERGDLDTRQVLSASTTGKAAGARFERITHVPVVPDGASDDGWRYAWSDPDADDTVISYRISAELPGGGEAWNIRATLAR